MDPVVPDCPVTQFAHPGGPGDTDFVQAPLTEDHQGTCAAETFENLGQHGRQAWVVYTQDLHIGPCRIRQRPQDIEDGTNTDFSTRSDGVLHGTMKLGRVQKADADLIHARFNHLGAYVQIDAQRLEYIGTAALARYASVAVFGHFEASPRHHKGGGGGHVEGVCPIAAGAARVDDGFPVYVDLVSVNIYNAI